MKRAARLASMFVDWTFMKKIYLIRNCASRKQMVILKSSRTISTKSKNLKKYSCQSQKTNLQFKMPRKFRIKSSQERFSVPTWVAFTLSPYRWINQAHSRCRSQRKINPKNMQCPRERVSENKRQSCRSYPRKWVNHRIPSTAPFHQQVHSLRAWDLLFSKRWVSTAETVSIMEQVAVKSPNTTNQVARPRKA